MGEISAIEQEKLTPTNPSVERDEPFLIRIKGKFMSLFQKEWGSSKPRLKVSVVYGPHVSRNHIQILREEFGKADIFIPEFLGWDSESSEIYNGVSFGTITPNEAVGMMKKTSFPDYLTGQFQMIAGSHKPIAFIDLPAEKMADFKANSLIKEWDRKVGLMYLQNQPFESLLEMTRSYISSIARSDAGRESYMASQFPDAVRQVLQHHPDLRKKGMVNVLISLGAMHTPISHTLRQQGYNVTRKFLYSPTIYSFFEEAERRSTFDKKVDDLLLARLILAEFLGHGGMTERLSRITDDINKIFIFERKVVSLFSMEDIRELFVIRGRNSRDNRFGNALRKKGVTIPRNEAELNKFLESRYNITSDV